MTVMSIVGQMSVELAHSHSRSRTRTRTHSTSQ